MNELLAALIGALVGGAVSAVTAGLQTRHVLRHEVELANGAAEETRKAERAASARTAALRMLDGLAVYTTVPQRLREWHRWFGGTMPASEHAAVDERVRELGRLDASASLALDPECRERWHNLYRLALWCHRFVDEVTPTHRRDIRDTVTYGEYVRRTLAAVVDGEPLPAKVAPPDPQRSGERPWGWEPPEGAGEPDFTDWMRSMSSP